MFNAMPTEKEYKRFSIHTNHKVRETHSEGKEKNDESNDDLTLILPNKMKKKRKISSICKAPFVLHIRIVHSQYKIDLDHLSLLGFLLQSYVHVYVRCFSLFMSSYLASVVVDLPTQNMWFFASVCASIAVIICYQFSSLNSNITIPDTGIDIISIHLFDVFSLLFLSLLSV